MRPAAPIDADAAARRHARVRGVGAAVRMAAAVAAEPICRSGECLRQHRGAGARHCCAHYLLYLHVSRGRQDFGVNVRGVAHGSGCKGAFHRGGRIHLRTRLDKTGWRLYEAARGCQISCVLTSRRPSH
eukprot:scaffold326353_cov55-Tisochrysis_lutea.AAC.7